jgi:hypothetical protein
MFKHLKSAALAACALQLSACAAIVEGRYQEITINTNPPGADCAIERQGATIARVGPTPGSATIRKNKEDISIVCREDGYQQATWLNHSGIEEWTFGNIVIGGLIGWGIDSATGSDNEYTSPVNVTLVPKVAQIPGSKSSASVTELPAPPPGSPGM